MSAARRPSRGVINLQGRPDEDFHGSAVAPQSEQWVELQLKLLNWKYMNFSTNVRTSTHIFTIKNMLQDRQGDLGELRMCLGAFSDANELTDEMATLKDHGVVGAPLGQELPVVQILYDFKPVKYSDPLLLHS